MRICSYPLNTPNFLTNHSAGQIALFLYFIFSIENMKSLSKVELARENVVQICRRRLMEVC